MELESDLVEGQEIPQALKAEVAEHGETLRPDWMLAEPKTKKPRLLVKMYPRSQSLTKPVSGTRWKASPDTRMAELLRNCGADSRLGLVTNGEQWMLVHAPQGETTGYASWYSNLWFEETLTQRAFRTLLSLDRFFGVPDEETLEELLKRSAEDQQEVTDQLGYQVRRAVEVLVQSLDRADRDYKGELLKDVPEALLYEAALTVMMRLVFLFCAEERELLLLGDELYDGNYAVSTLREQLQETADQHGEEVLSLRYDAWSRLLTTFRAVYGGVQHQDFKLPAYGGHLFDPDRFPFLEGRKSNTKWKETPAQPLPVNNQTVLHLLKSLQLLEVKMPGRKSTIETQKLSFRALGIEQIGHVYEGLLDHTAVRATEPVLGFGGGRDKEPEIPLSKLEGLLGEWGFDAEIAAAAKAEKDKTKRKEIEESNAPPKQFIDFVKKATGKTPKSIWNALGADLNDEFRSHFRTACQGDDELWGRVERLAGLVRIDTFGYPVVIPAGSVYVTAGMDRRSSGTHYTPRSLTEPIVQYTLEPLVYEGPAAGVPKDKWKLKSPKDLLDLKICDMACGSGAFLVQAARYMAERLLEAWEAVEEDATGEVKITPFGEPSTGEPDEQLIPDDPDERIVYARRTVAQRCLYGVDVNPLATEMAKLSLWLLTLAKDKPFTFLDHSIRCGDSLIGISSIDQLERFSLNGGGPQKSFAHEQIKRRIDAAKTLRLQLERMPTNSVEDIERKTEMLKRANEQSGRLRYAADRMLAVQWQSMNDAEREQELQDTLIDVEFKFKDVAITELERESALKLGQVGCAKTFHWPIEFPEVFADSGLHAFVCNPPFLGGAGVSKVLSDEYNTFLFNHNPDASRKADLIAHFVIRAYELLAEDGLLGFLGTKTVAEGITKKAGLARAVKLGGTVVRTRTPFPWPGSASVQAVTFYISKGVWQGESKSDNTTVSGISASLTEQEVSLESVKRLAGNSGKCFQGSFMMSTGFLVTPAEAARWIKEDQRNESVLFPYMGGREFNDSPTFDAPRWAINFGEMEHDEAAEYSLPFNHVRNCVYPERMEKDAEKYPRMVNEWWKDVHARHALYDSITSLQKVLVRSRVCSRNMVGFIPANWVYSDALIVFVTDSFCDFANLQSSFHNSWTDATASTMRTDVRYVQSRCFDTYPISTNPSSSVSEVGEKFYSFRQQLLIGRNEGLTRLYGHLSDSTDTSSDIQSLRNLIVELDHVVAAAYGWENFDLGHDFHETKQGIRYTISEAARREVLQRLLKLNHERYAEEVKQGLHDKKKAKKKRATKKRAAKKAPKPQTPTLFDMETVDTAFGTKDSEKLLCGVVLDVVAAEPELQSSAYLDALVIVLRHERHSKLLVGDERTKFTKLCKKIPKAWVQEVNQIPWSELKDLLTLQNAIVVKGKSVSVGDAFTNVRESYPAIDSNLIDLLVKASGELRALKASTKPLPSEDAEELATFEQDSASLCGEIA